MGIDWWGTGLVLIMILVAFGFAELLFRGSQRIDEEAKKEWQRKCKVQAEEFRKAFKG